MRYVRLYAGPDGESHFEDVDVGLSPTGLSELYPAPGAHFLRSPVGEVIDWHPAPRRQFVVTLAGGVEVQASDGDVRRFAPGDVLLVEDLAGRGHITRVVGTVERLSLLIPLLE